MQEKISALVDGELSGDCVDVALTLLHQPGGFATLDAYHQIRHVLRTGEQEALMSTDFTARLMAILGSV